MLPEERRSQLLDCAQALFFTKGFDDTTVQDVLDMAGVSKGGFYHHFNSKDELLFGVLDRMGEAIFGQMDSIVEAGRDTALHQLHQFLHLRANYLKENDYPGQVEFFRAMHMEQNTLLLHKFIQSVRAASSIVLAKIIRKGMADGTFDVRDADVAAELIVFLSTFMDDALLAAIEARGTDRAAKAAQKLQQSMDMQFLAIDRVLGLPDGTTNFGWPEAVDATMATVPAELQSSTGTA